MSLACPVVRDAIGADASERTIGRSLLRYGVQPATELNLSLFGPPCWGRGFVGLPKGALLVELTSLGAKVQTILIYARALIKKFHLFYENRNRSA